MARYDMKYFVFKTERKGSFWRRRMLVITGFFIANVIFTSNIGAIVGFTACQKDTFGYIDLLINGNCPLTSALFAIHLVNSSSFNDWNLAHSFLNRGQYRSSITSRSWFFLVSFLSFKNELRTCNTYLAGVWERLAKSPTVWLNLTTYFSLEILKTSSKWETCLRSCWQFSARSLISTHRKFSSNSPVFMFQRWPFSTSATFLLRDVNIWWQSCFWFRPSCIFFSFSKSQLMGKKF